VHEGTYLLRHLFGLGYRRVLWKCKTLNLRSRTAAERLGFSFEGVFRKDHMLVPGRAGAVHSRTLVYSITEAEWPDERPRWMPGWRRRAHADQRAAGGRRGCAAGSGQGPRGVGVAGAPGA
jgi:hypothetical protein